MALPIAYRNSVLTGPATTGTGGLNGEPPSYCGIMALPDTHPLRSQEYQARSGVWAALWPE